MTTTDAPIRIQSAAVVVEFVPFLLGFHPADSLVVVGLNDSRIEVTARLDLTDANPSTLTHVFETVAVRARCPEAITIVFGAPGVATRLQASLELAAQRADVRLIDCLYVADGRWRSVLCGDLECCPPEGTPLPTGPTAVLGAATYAGLTALPDRAALEAMFDPLDDRPDLAAELQAEQNIERNAALTGRHDRYTRSVIRALFAAHRAAQAGALPADDAVARYGVALQSYGVRDAAWMAIDDGRLQGIELWVNLARRLPGSYNAAPLFLAAWRSYRDGNGAVAGIAANLALASDPDYSAANLLLAALAHDVDPRTLRRLHPPRIEEVAD